MVAPRRSTAETPTRPATGSTDGAAAARVQQLVVVAAAKQTDIGAVTLRRNAVAIGRSPDGPRPIALDDGEVSRTHAVVEPDESLARWQIVDRDSRNGTFVNGARVARAALTHGSVVRVGRALLVFVEVEIPTGAPLLPETDELLGGGVSMMRLRGEIARVAPQPISVLVLGESGVGKERVAHALHKESRRRGPLVAINCAALPAALAESELFGHAAGAFTGAGERREGLFAAADGGTLFLDEIGELPEGVQAKLLRALATGEVRAVGRADAQRHDVRVVAATNRDLARDVDEGRFRGDLFARVSGWTLRVPPLRERREDILGLAAAFLARRGGRPLSTGSAEALLLHDWPYNVRELEQAMASAAVRATDDDVVRSIHLPSEIAALAARRSATASARPDPPLDLVVSRERIPDAEELRLALERFGGNVTQVAEFFGRDRRQVYRWLTRAGIAASTHRDKP